MNTRIARMAGYGELLLLLVPLFLSARSIWERPEWNFDVVGYVAVAASHSHSDPVEVHKLTYEQLRDGLPPGDYRKLTTGSVYRRALARRPDALLTQLRFYRNKPAYVAMVRLVHAMGVNLALATLIVSLVAYVLMALSIRWWLGRYVPRYGASALASCILLSHPVVLAARMSAPDMLATLFVVPGLVSLLEQRWRLGFALLIASVAVRPDAFVLLTLVCSALAFSPPTSLSRKTIAAHFAAGLTCYFVVGQVSNSYPHRLLLKHALTTRLYEPSRMGELITWSEYVEGLYNGILVHGYSLYPTSIWPFAAIGGLAILAAGATDAKHVPTLLVACALYVAIHAALFPVINDRYFVGQFVFAALAAVSMVSRRISATGS